MVSKRDNRGVLCVDCSECERGGNGSDPDKCSCGWKIKKPHKGSCFSGTLMEKYRAETLAGAAIHRPRLNERKVGSEQPHRQGEDFGGNPEIHRRVQNSAG